jgi:hypothetical protein
MSQPGFTYRSRLIEANRARNAKRPVELKYVPIVPSVLPAYVKEITPDVQLQLLKCETAGSNARAYLLDVLKDVVPSINKAITLLKGPISQDVIEDPTTQQLISTLIHVYNLLIHYSSPPIQDNTTWIDNDMTRPLIDYIDFIDCIVYGDIDTINRGTSQIEHLTGIVEQNMKKALRKAAGPPMEFTLIPDSHTKTQAAGRRRRRRVTRKPKVRRNYN